MINAKEYINYSPFSVDSELFSGSEFLGEQFHKKFSKVPQKIKDLMIDKPTAEFIKKIITDFGLSGENGKELARIIRDIVLGDVFYKDLKTAIERRVKIDVVKTEQITTIINNQLFAPVMEDIKKVQAPLEKEFASMPRMPGQRPPQKTSPAPLHGQPATSETPPLKPQAETTAYFDEFDDPVPEENVIDLKNI